MVLKNNIFIAFTICFCLSTFAQSERKMARKGNTQYETGNFIDAEINYKKALAKNADLLEAQFNLGDALVKQERFDEALESFEKVSAATDDPNLKANALYNKGNVLLSQQDLEGALESYKDALRIDPKDHETRYNYAYVKKRLDQQQQEQEQNEENQDENKDDKEQNEENKDKGDQKNEDSEDQDQEDSENEDKEEGQQDQGENKEDESQQDQQDKGQTDGEDSDEEKKGEQPKPRENKLSPEEAQRLLDALNQQEDKVQDKMKKHKLKGAKVKIEKDW